MYLDIFDVLTRRHHVIGRLVTKANNTLQHALLVLYVVFVGQLKGLFQVVHAQLAALLGYSLLRNHATFNQDCFQRPEHFPQEHDSTHGFATELQRGLTTVYLRHNLTEEQQHERKKNRNDNKFQPCHLELHQRTKDVIAKHDDGNVHKVVGNQDGCQRPFRVVAQLFYPCITRILICIQLFQVLRRKTEERNLRTACEARHQK